MPSRRKKANRKKARTIPAAESAGETEAVPSSSLCDADQHAVALGISAPIGSSPSVCERDGDGDDGNENKDQKGTDGSERSSSRSRNAFPKRRRRQEDAEQLVLAQHGHLSQLNDLYGVISFPSPRSSDGAAGRSKRNRVGEEEESVDNACSQHSSSCCEDGDHRENESSEGKEAQRLLGRTSLGATTAEDDQSAQKEPQPLPPPQSSSSTSLSHPNQLTKKRIRRSESGSRERSRSSTARRHLMTMQTSTDPTTRTPLRFPLIPRLASCGVAAADRPFMSVAVTHATSILKTWIASIPSDTLATSSSIDSNRSVDSRSSSSSSSSINSCAASIEP